ncbi:S41 family peptidase [Rhodanobacter sp. AS-Z3]|uniref:S41 family peptidase n=1 Tax=Rhodanobacter sp. AS-Z3 TaxID=3031330 RepID=UPI00247A30F5|nr:S41 family peptidase [Rhodanobacter sp. AS-Z3]WEN14046.1 S41 family peptidase [Rhodanobacter sp. AS-Z3]
MHRLLVVVLFACVGIAPMSGAAAPTDTSWRITGSGHGYDVHGSGDLLGEDGATVSLRAQHADPVKFGSSVSVLDATRYRGRTIRLSADLDTHDAVNGALIWLRADNAAHQIISFANSQRMPVVATTTDAHRAVQIDVPTAATSLLLGTVLNGNGEVTARQLRLVVLDTSTTARVAPASVLDAAIRIVQAHALHARDVDWVRLVPELHAMASDAVVPIDVYPAIRQMLNALGDHHSYLMPPSDAHQHQTSGGATSPSSVELKPGSVGYIEMPGYEGMNAPARHAFVASMVGAIGTLAPQVRCGWVVDLRHDTGGSMLPMLAGLRPLLGDEPLGSFRYADGNETKFAAANPLDQAPARGPELEHDAVAVLLGPHTSSSGEVMAIAFQGRPGTRSFGQPTDGRSTGNSAFPLPDGSLLVITTTVDVDRNGHAYGGKLMPDQAIDATTSAASDPTLTAALAWLAASCVH